MGGAFNMAPLFIARKMCVTLVLQLAEPPHRAGVRAASKPYQGPVRYMSQSEQAETRQQLLHSQFFMRHGLFEKGAISGCSTWIGH